MRVSEDGQITIPPHIQRRTGLTPGVEVDVVEQDGAALLKPRQTAPPRKGLSPEEARAMIERMRGTAKLDMSTDEYIRMVRGPSADEELGGVA